MCEVLQLQSLPPGALLVRSTTFIPDYPRLQNRKFKVSKLLTIQMGPVAVLMTKKVLAMFPECFPPPGESFPKLCSELGRLWACTHMCVHVPHTCQKSPVKMFPSPFNSE